MKKIFKGLIVFVFAVLLTGCSDEKLNPKNMSSEEIIGELKLINNNLIHIWNDSLVVVSWYTMEGTDEKGNEIDIENAITKLKLYYEDIDDYNTFIHSLDDKYNGVKETFDKTIEQLDIVYEAILKQTPKKYERVEYRDNISEYSNLQTQLEEQIMNLEK